jgi:hypothetical protein
MSSYGRKLFIGITGIYFSYISLGYLAEDLYHPHHAGSAPSSKHALPKMRQPMKSSSFHLW